MDFFSGFREPSLKAICVLDDLGAQRSTTKGHFKVQAWISIDVDGFRDFILRSFQVPWAKKGVFVHSCFHVSFSGDFLGLDMDVWDWKTMRLVRDVLQKPTFGKMGFLMNLGSTFYDYGWPWKQFS